MTNIQKVAELAGVSVATVSRVINNSDKVSEKARQKVEKAIASLNYVPNMLARNFRTAESRSILVMVTSISNFFYMETVHGISEYAYENGYDILLSETNEDVKRQIDGLLKVKNHMVDGAIIMESTIKDKLLLSLEKTNPVVQCSVFSGDTSIPFVSVDNYRGGFIAAETLLSRGHRRIAYIGTDDKARYNIDRRRGFLESMALAGVTQDMQLIVNAELSFEGGARISRELMKLPSPPTALFFTSDMQAIGAINSLTSAGYKIPQDVAVLGFDNLEICNMVVPGLTTVSQPMHEIGREACRLLIEQIRNNGESSCKNIIFQPEIVFRESV